MKNIIKVLLISSIAFFFYNCSNEDKLIDQVLDGVQNGIILRNIEIYTGEYDNDNPSTANFSAKVEIQDSQNGNYTSKINVYASYKDNNGGPNNRAEALVKSIPASDFSSGPNGLPQTIVTVTMSELRSTLNLTAAQVRTCDVASIRLEAEGNDGRKFTNSNSSATITGGSYFSSPFLYSANIVGGALVDTLAGNHTFETSGMFIPGSASCGGTVTGTITWTESGTPGVYNVNDMSFGLFESSCWFDAPAYSSSSQVKWFCKTLTSLGTDQYGSTWTYTIKSVVGPVMKIEFLSSYLTGEGGIVTITREGGVNWPAIMQD
jgi:hypothetical protein